MNKPKLITVALLMTFAIAAAAAERIIAKEFELWNFAAFGATALFSGAVFGRKWIAFLLPLVALLVSDLLLTINGNEAYVKYMSSGGFLLNYISYPVIILIGAMMHNKITASKVFAGSIAASVSFFIVSNFIVWAGGSYSMDISGFFLCYERALPYFKGTVAGDLAFSAVLFGSYYLLSLRIPALSKA